MGVNDAYLWQRSQEHSGAKQHSTVRGTEWMMEKWELLSLLHLRFRSVGSLQSPATWATYDSVLHGLVLSKTPVYQSQGTSVVSSACT